MEQLRKFLQGELKKSNYRALAERLGIGRTTLEDIIKGKVTTIELGTCERIAVASQKPLWEVLQMAGVNLGLPSSGTEATARLDQMVQRMPELGALVDRLKDLWDVDPDYVKGMIIGLESTLDRNGK